MATEYIEIDGKTMEYNKDILGGDIKLLKQRNKKDLEEVWNLKSII